MKEKQGNRRRGNRRRENVFYCEANRYHEVTIWKISRESCRRANSKNVYRTHHRPRHHHPPSPRRTSTKRGGRHRARRRCAHSITQSLNHSIDRSIDRAPRHRRDDDAGTRERVNARMRERDRTVPEYSYRTVTIERTDRRSISLPLFLSSSRVSHSRRVINPIHRLNRYSSESSHQCRCDAIEFDADELHCIEGRSMEDRGRRIERKRDEERRWVEARSRCVVSSNARDDDDPRWCR